MPSSEQLLNALHCASQGKPDVNPAGIVGPDLTFLAMSPLEAKLAGFGSPEKCQALTHYDLPCAVANSAPEFQRHYQKVIQTGKPLDAFNIHTYADNDLRAFITRKMPLFDMQNNLEMIPYFGCEVPTHIIKVLKTLLVNNVSHYLNNKVKLSITYEMVEKYEALGLTVRESECLFYMIRGRSAQAIAAILNLSVRTIETYIDNMKQKLNLFSKTALIDYAITFHLVNKIPYAIVRRFI